jgi:polar amino acid transport system substrate-binding protein
MPTSVRLDPKTERVVRGTATMVPLRFAWLSIAVLLVAHPASPQDSAAVRAELAKRLDVPIEYIPYRNSGETQAAAATGLWDVTFMPVDDERKKVLDFGSPYHLLQSTYLVAAGSPIQTIADANRAGVRIVGVRDTATFRASQRASPHATHAALEGPADAVEAVLAARADAIALSRASLGGVAAKIPGWRILDGGFLNSTTAVAVPKGKAAALADVSAFIEEAKASGLVRRGLDGVGLTNEQVAPAGMKP